MIPFIPFFQGSQLISVSVLELSFKPNSSENYALIEKVSDSVRVIILKSLAY